MATLGPGSGIGVSALVPSADGWTVMTGEGGHVSLPAYTSEEQDVIALLRERFGHCSAERVLSGQGLVNLYVALAELAGRGQPTVTPEDVTRLASQREPLARKTLQMFFAMLGTVAGDLALTTGALGGVYIAGGIVPRLLDVLAQSEFRSRFETKGRYRRLHGRDSDLRDHDTAARVSRAQIPARLSLSGYFSAASIFLRCSAACSSTVCCTPFARSIVLVSGSNTVSLRGGLCSCGGGCELPQAVITTASATSNNDDLKVTTASPPGHHSS